MCSRAPRPRAPPPRAAPAGGRSPPRAPRRRGRRRCGRPRRPRSAPQVPSSGAPSSSGEPSSVASCWSARQASLLGKTCPFSHRLTVENVTLSAWARPSWVRPTRRRHLRITCAACEGGPADNDTDERVARMIVYGLKQPRCQVGGLEIARLARHTAAPKRHARVLRPNDDAHGPSLQLGGALAKRETCPTRRRSWR